MSLDTTISQIPSDLRVFQAASGVSSSYDALLDLFESLGNFLSRLEVYTQVPPTPMMTGIIIKIIVELLRVLGLVTKEIRQGRFSENTIMYAISTSYCAPQRNSSRSCLVIARSRTRCESWTD